MAEENDFQPRPGRIRSSRSQRAKPFIAQALAAAQRAGGGVSRQGLLRGRLENRKIGISAEAGL